MGHKATENVFPRKVFTRTLESPMKGLDDVMSWGASQSLNLFTTNFQDYYKMYAQASNSFTTEGWEQIRGQLVSSGLFEAVVQKIGIYRHYTAPSHLG